MPFPSDIDPESIVYEEENIHAEDPELEQLPEGEAPAATFEERIDEATKVLSYLKYPLEELLSAVKKRDGKAIQIRGLRGSLLGALLVELQRRLSKPLAIVTPTKKRARSLSRDMKFFGGGETTLLPPLDVTPYAGLTPNRLLLAERLGSFEQFLQGTASPLMLFPVKGLMRFNPPAEIFRTLNRTIELGAEINLSDLRHWLISTGYSPAQLVEDPGTFAIRGGTVDIFVFGTPQPIRIELLGDEIETICFFSPKTQKRGEETDEFIISPVREEVFTSETLLCARRRLRVLAEERRIPSASLRKVLVDLEHGIHFLGIEALLPAFYPTLDPSLDLIPEDAIIIIVEPERCEQAAQEYWTMLQQQFEHRNDEGILSFPPNDLCSSPEEFWEHLNARADRIHVDAFDVIDEEILCFDALENHDVVRLRKEQTSIEMTLKSLLKRLDGWREVYGEIGFVCHSAGHRERLIELLQDAGEVVERQENNPFDLGKKRTPPSSSLMVYAGELSAGFRCPTLGFALVTEEELFGKRKIRRVERKQTAEHAIASFRELMPGDHLVHIDHGIGRYEGLKGIEVQGLMGDFLLLTYANDDRLYVPIHHLGGLQRFSGDKKRRLDRLGSSVWERTKNKVKEGLKEMAVELLRLYAARQARKGYAFSPPDEQFRAFEESFPFEETVDQARAIQETLADMQSDLPMDRLVCGDVGFGKTEIAMRAAYKAIADGKQVAVLVPTTLLAEQHLSSFITRFSDTAVEIESMSRFRTPKEVRQTLKKLSKGQLDIVIGTHRLLSKDVKFRSLGLLIVDEEHRFGVAHKEKIKQISTTVDVLTMTATPIPRTLQMSMVGIRDMSLISTPPVDRLSIRTHIARFGSTVIREAIIRELRRGGQVYFLHNRVRNIEDIAAKIRALVPEARVTIGHGQMNERTLEKVMLDFVRGETNVFVCTTIIESGIDIPNANTMIINHADHLGLAQLYQIRGRVGRASRRAHCYLLIPEDAKITADAERRLEALQRFTELGSGFEIASWDLEMRGAGNILSAEQSGNVAAVGMDLFAELLEETLAELRGEESLESKEPEINIPVESRLPESYIPDVQLRLLFYKRLSSVIDEEELFEVYGELKDRFGEPPKPVDTLRRVISIKLMVKRMRALGIDVSSSALVLKIGEVSLLDPRKVVSIVKAHRRHYHLTPDMRLVRYLRPKEAEDLIEATRHFLDYLLTHACLGG